MNWITIAIGLGAILYGLFTLVLRVKAPEKFGKLEAMEKAWGDKAGLAIHFVAYTVAPVAVGISLVLAGMNGVALFGK